MVTTQHSGAAYGCTAVARAGRSAPVGKRLPKRNPPRRTGCVAGVALASRVNKSLVGFAAAPIAAETDAKKAKAQAS